MNPRALFVFVAVLAAAPAAARPGWGPGKVTAVRILGSDAAPVRTITDRAELDAFATWLARAREVEPRSGKVWTHKLDVDAPGGGRLLYDRDSGEYTVLSMKATPVYRLDPVDRARLDQVIAGRAAAPNGEGAERAPFAFTSRLSDLEGQWAVLPPNEEGAHPLAFVYVDPEEGFTLDHAGFFRIDAGGSYVRVGESHEGTLRTILRLNARTNGPAAPLPREALAALGLPHRPEWLAIYADRSDPITHAVRWGTHLNHVGDPGRALEHLEPAQAKKPDAEGLAYELAYAYNALGRQKEALGVLENAVVRRPDDIWLGSELAYAYLASGRFAKAVEQYLKVIPLCTDDQLRTKSEAAMNLSTAYEQLGDAANAAKWRNHAKAWAPEGSPLHQYLHR